MFVSLKANKKRMIAFLVLVVVVVAACLLLNKGGKVEVEEYFGGSNEERVAFLQSFGWEISADPIESREVMIPEKFNDVYNTYNEMQIAQGFDLKPYAGYNCMQYKYLVSNYPDSREVYATLLIYDSKILGGDLACAEVDGFMHGFAADSAAYGEKNNSNSNQSGENANEAAPESSMIAAESSVPENNAGIENNAQDNNTAQSNAAEDNAQDNNAGDNNATANSENGTEQTGGEVTDEGAYPTD